jgi:hypothetical protein
LRTVFAILLLASSLLGQSSAFRYRPDRPATMTLHHYTKSNLDASHTGHFYIYIVDGERIEVLKLEPGANDAVYIQARMDWATFSETDLSMFHIRRNDDRQHIFDGKLENGEFTLILDPEQKMIKPPFAIPSTMTVSAAAAPVHIYGFELIGLNLSLPHLQRPNGGFRVTLIGDNPKFSADDPNVLAPMGDLTVKYIGDQSVRGQNTRLYSLTGPLLDGREGSMWVSKKTGLIELLKSPKPNNGAWTSLRLEHQDTRKMTLPEWREWMKTEAARHIAEVEARP